MSCKYEIVKAGDIPTWDNGNHHSFQNPVAVGDKVKPNGAGTDLLTVVAVEHYEDCSVLYCE